MAATRWTAAENKLKYALTDPTSSSTTSTQAGPNGIDIANSVDIGAVRANSSFWVFGDAWWLNAAGKTRGQLYQPNPHNLVGLQTGRDLSTATFRAYTGNSDAAPMDYFAPLQVGGTPAWRYPFGGLLLDDRLLIVGAFCEAHPTAGNFNTAMSGSWATLLWNLSDNDPRNWTQQSVPVDLGNLRYSNTRQYCFGCNPIDPGDGYVYFYCFGPQASNAWAVCRAARASVKNGDLSGLRWWDGGTKWLPDQRDARGRIFRRRVNVLGESLGGNDQAGGFSLRSDGQIQATYVVDGGWREAVAGQTATGFPYPLKRATRATPTGRFPAGTQIVSAPVSKDTHDFIYSAYHLPEQTWSGQGASDQFVIVNYNRSSVDVFSDSLTYWPQIWQVT